MKGQSRYSIMPVLAFQDSALSPRDLTVLAVVGSHTDEFGWCFPSMSRIGEMLGVSRQAVQRSVAHLVEAGYLTKQARFRENGSQTSNGYHVNMDFVPPADRIRGYEPPDEAGEGVQQQVAGVQQQVAGGATSEVAPITTPFKEDRYTNARAREDSARIASQSGERASEQDGQSRFADWYALYPIKKGRAVAEKAWRKAGLDALADALIEKLVLQKSRDRQFLEGFAPHPATYLNQRRWEDEIEEVKHESSRGNGRPGGGYDGRSRARRVADKLDEIARRDIEENGITEFLG